MSKNNIKLDAIRWLENTYSGNLDASIIDALCVENDYDSIDMLLEAYFDEYDNIHGWTDPAGGYHGQDVSKYYDPAAKYA